MLDLYEFKYLSKPAQISLVELKKLFDILGINPALLDNPNDREKGVAELLKKAQDLGNTAVVLESKLASGFDLWGEPLANQQQVQMLRSACTAVKNEFSNYSAKFNTPAKLNNFALSAEQVEALGKQITLMQVISEYLLFKTECASIVSYISSIEYIEMGAVMKGEIEAAKATFREVRDDIMDGTTGSDAAQKVAAVLEKIKAKYIDIYYEEHKKKRLGIEDAKRRGKVQESVALSNLRKLRTIDILSSAKLTEIEQDLASLKTCYDLTPAELKTSPVCPHCRFSLDDKAKNVSGQIDALEDRIEALVTEWTKMLLDTISDPLVLSQKEYLSAQQAAIIDSFVDTGVLPQRVDDFFVKSIQALLKNYEPVVIVVEELVHKLEELPPMDEASFKAKINDIIGAYTKGKDASTLRIVVKRKESEE